MAIRILAVAGLLVATLAVIGQTDSAGAVRGEGESTRPARRLVLVELFTSEGCSSCPPADLNLKELDEQQPVEGVQVVALGMHVDYWNRLGWPDGFSSRTFTDRQRGYGARMQLRSVYTPQLIVGGTTELVGSDVGRARQAIRAAGQSRPLGVTVSPVVEGRLKVAVEGAAQTGKGEVWVAVTESGLWTAVKRGENAGRRVEHGPVVRAMAKAAAGTAGKWTAEMVVEKGWVTDRLRVVAFVQNEATGEVSDVGVGQVTVK